MRDRHIFVNARGQDDNVGDSVLRRHYLAMLRKHGPLHVLVSGQSGSYVSGLGVARDDTLYSSAVEWQTSLLGMAARGACHLAANAGEVQSSTQSRFNRAAIAASIRATHLRGGSVIAAGIGVRAGGDLSAEFRRSLGRYDLLSFRDSVSRDRVGFGDVNPDWAFAEEPASQLDLSDRTTIAVTMRGDRPAPSDLWFKTLDEFSANTGMRIEVTVQVRRDEERSQLLSSRLSHAVFHPWPAERSHEEQERALSAVYRKSIAVVSDRLHGLILGSTSGAAPIGLSTASPEKLDRTFLGAGLNAVSVELEAEAHSTARTLVERVESNFASNHGLKEARSALGQLGSRVEEVLHA